MSISDPVRYFLKQKHSLIYNEITDHITEHVSGVYKLSDFSDFELKTEELSNQNDTFIEPSKGDEIAVVNKTLDQVFFNGFIQNTNKKINYYDSDTTPNYKYHLECLEYGFNNPFTFDYIQDVTYTNFSFTNILDVLLQATPFDILGGATLDKYTLYINDYTVNSASFKNKSTNKAIKDFLSDQNLLWNIKYLCQYDATNNLKIERSLRVFDRQGIQAQDNSVYSIGVTHETNRLGFINTPYLLNSDIETIPTESDIETIEDNSNIINHLILEANVYKQTDKDILTRYIKNAQTRVFDYEFQLKASDIPYIATAIESTVLENSTTTEINLIKPKGNRVNVGDVVLVLPELDTKADIDTVNVDKFRTVTEKTQTDTITTLTLDSALSFQPSKGDYFEVVKNHDIYKDNSETDQKRGVVIDVSNRGNASTRIRFLDLSEPHQPQKILLYARSLNNFSKHFINQESIDNIGETRTKKITLDSDTIYTYKEVNEIADKLLQLEPNYKINTTTYRNGILEDGTQINVNMDDYISDKFIVNSNRLFFDGGIDDLGQPFFTQEIELSTLKDTSEDILKDIINKREPSPTIDFELIRKQTEFITITDLLTIERLTYQPLFDRSLNYSCLIAPTSDTGLTIPDKSGNGNNMGLTGTTLESDSVYGQKIPLSGDTKYGTIVNQLVNDNGFTWLFGIEINLNTDLNDNINLLQIFNAAIFPSPEEKKHVVTFSLNPKNGGVIMKFRTMNVCGAFNMQNLNVGVGSFNLYEFRNGINKIGFTFDTTTPALYLVVNGVNVPLSVNTTLTCALDLATFSSIGFNNIGASGYFFGNPLLGSGFDGKLVEFGYLEGSEILKQSELEAITAI